MRRISRPRSELTRSSVSPAVWIASFVWSAWSCPPGGAPRLPARDTVGPAEPFCNLKSETWSERLLDPTPIRGATETPPVTGIAQAARPRIRDGLDHSTRARLAIGRGQVGFHLRSGPSWATVGLGAPVQSQADSQSGKVIPSSDLAIVEVLSGKEGAATPPPFPENRTGEFPASGTSLSTHPLSFVREERIQAARPIMTAVKATFIRRISNARS